MSNHINPLRSIDQMTQGVQEKKECTECGDVFETTAFYASRCDDCYQRYLKKYGMGVNNNE